MSRQPHERDPMDPEPEASGGNDPGKEQDPGKDKESRPGQGAGEEGEGGISRRKMIAIAAWGAGLFAYTVPRVAMARADAETTPDNSNVEPAPKDPRAEIGAERMAVARETLTRFTDSLERYDLESAMQEVAEDYWDGARGRAELERDLRSTLESLGELRIEPSELLGLGDDGRQIYVEFDAQTTGRVLSDGSPISFSDTVEVSLAGRESLQICSLRSVQTFQ